MTLQTRIEEAFQNFMLALQDAWTPVEVQERGAETYRIYSELLQEIWQPEVQQRVQEAWRNYEQVLERALASDHTRQRVTEALRIYLHTVRDAWIELDPDLMDIGSVKALSQNMMAVTWIAGMSMAATPDLTFDTFSNINPFQPTIGGEETRGV